MPAVLRRIGSLHHDTGKLIFAEAFQDDYTRVLETTRSRNITLWEAEMEAFGISHAEIGAYLLGLWGFEEELVLGVARHHQPERAGSTPPLAVPLIHVANALEHELVVINRQYAPHPLQLTALEAMGLAGRIEPWREACRTVLEGGVRE